MHRRISRHRETGHQAGALVRAPVHPARGGARGAIVAFSQTPRECKPRRSTQDVATGRAPGWLGFNPHTLRNAALGSTRAARIAGTTHAASVTPASSTHTP